MNSTLKTYQAELLVKGPVYVGSGKEIGKKEYVFLGGDRIGVLSPEKFYEEMKRRGKVRQFEKFLLENPRGDLTGWISKEGIRTTEINHCIRYTLKCRELVEARKNRSKLQIMECIKDPYGKPYIPGSSIKGMLRTILLGCDMIENAKLYQAGKSNMTYELFSPNKGNKKTLLSRSVKKMETDYFRTLNREGTKPEDAVNDILQGLIVSDSEPLELDDLTLSQAVELHTDGAEMVLPILRESIKPGSRIRFTITIDPLCPIDIEYLEHAVKIFANQTYDNFGKKFPGLDRMRENQVLFGGGAGFVSKTIVYPLCGKDKGVRVTQKIFEKTDVTDKHKHSQDTKTGVSPHIQKCTRYEGKLCKMGLCDISFKELS